MGKDVTSISRVRLWTGRVITGLMALFFLFDVSMKFVQPKPVAESFVQAGWPIGLSAPLGAVLLASTILYLIPRTSILGAILLTGYLGGAVAANLRLEEPLFSHTLFPVYFGVLVWGTLWLRDPKLQELVPLRSSR
jgi:ABC-type transport system involved in cytochrome c biogenesis permease component